MNRYFRVVDKLQTAMFEVEDGSPAETADVCEYEKLMKCCLEELTEHDYMILKKAYSEVGL